MVDLGLLARQFDAKLQTLVDATDLPGVEALAEAEQVKAHNVNMDPYPDPDDRAESYANDYAVFLRDHHKKMAAKANAAAAKLSGAKANSDPPAKAAE